MIKGEATPYEFVYGTLWVCLAALLANAQMPLPRSTISSEVKATSTIHCYLQALIRTWHLVIILSRVWLIRIWDFSLSNLAHRNGRRPAALISLGGENHIVVTSQLQAALCPSIKVISGGDLASDAVALADGPELRKRSRPYDRGLVVALALVNVIGATIALDCAFLLSLAWVVRPISLDDVVLD